MRLNDVGIIIGIVSIFLAVGIALPYVNQAFDGDQSINADIDGLSTQAGQDVENVSSINAFTVLLSMLSMFFWTFGSLPFWLDAFFIILRLTLVITIARNIWIGGGS